MDIKIKMPISKSLDPSNHTNKIVQSKPLPSVIFDAAEPKFTFNDLILNDDVESELFDVIASKDYQDKVFNTWGLISTHKAQKKTAINLYGPPGTGKTMAAHAVASHLKKKIIEVNYADIESKYVGDTPKNLKAVFLQAERDDCVLFFDEADAMLSRRVTNMSNATDTSVNQTRSVLLMLLNNFSGTILFATNFISNYDEAFMRRILGHVHFSLPDAKSRHKIWNHLLPKRLPHKLNVEEISNEFDGISGSDISNAILKAAFKAARLGKEVIPHDLFRDAMSNIVKSKNENSLITISKKKVSESYVNKQLNKESA